MVAQIAGLPIVRRLGAGSEGEVFLVERPDGSRVAMKRLGPEADEARVRRVIEGLASVQHPSLVRARGVQRDGERLVVEMDHVEGVPLLAAVRPVRKAVGHVRPMLLGAFGYHPEDGGGVSAFAPIDAASAPRLERYVADLAGALAALHAAGWVHRDVQAENVLVTEDRAVLVDLGLVTADAARDGQAGIAAYLAPEDEIGPAADLYSLGVLIFEALTGALPFAGSAQEVVVRKRTVIAPAPSFVVALPTAAARLDALAVRLLRRVVADRPTAAEVARELADPR